MTISAVDAIAGDRFDACQALYASGSYAEALSLLGRLLQAEPSHCGALALAAGCFKKLRERDCSDIAQKDANEVDTLASAFADLGCWFFNRNNMVSAEHAFKKALVIRPRWPQVMTNLGIALRSQKRAHEAEALFRHVLDIAPNYPLALNSLGLVLWNGKRLTEAEALYRNAIRIQPEFKEPHNNLGLLLLDLNKHREAEAAFRRALEIDAELPESHNNLGNALMQQGRVHEAIGAYRQALALRPAYVAAKANLAQVLLRVGQFEEGWDLYESRHDAVLGTHYVNRPAVPWPQWKGESLAGKSLLVWPEQGHGDVLQFCRYLPLIRERGAKRLTIACAPPLQRLLSSLDGVDEVYPLDGNGAIAPHDYWCYVMSLPHIFGTTMASVPARVPYLKPLAPLVERWKARLPAEGFRVGLVWAGDPRLHTPASNAFDQRRSMSMRMFLPVLKIPGVTFVSLQKGETTQRQINDVPADLRPLDPMGDVQDFADTAAIIECLDLVITVDTSVAHVAGALNKPVWILSRYDACWRWLCDRDDSPWYPSARLFRQSEPGNWDEVVGRVAQALVKLSKAAPCT